MAKFKKFPLGTYMKQFSTEAQCQKYLADLRGKQNMPAQSVATATHIK